jgi:hypothetical protein
LPLKGRKEPITGFNFPLQGYYILGGIMVGFEAKLIDKVSSQDLEPLNAEGEGSFLL